MNDTPITTAQGNQVVYPPTTGLFTGQALPPALAIMMDDKVFERCRWVAERMAEAEGFTPKHLVGKKGACYAVVTRALIWKLEPFSVAQATYEVHGKIGYEGSLVQAIIENSGQVKGGVVYEDIGDWSKVQGKFKLEPSRDGKGKYAVATYTEADEVGLGVIARAQVIGEPKPREFKIMLREAHPRNSTLWATNPLQQLKYRAARGLGKAAMPGIFMGVPFEREDLIKESGPIIDATPDSATEQVKRALQEEMEKEKAKQEPVTVPHFLAAKNPPKPQVDPETGEVAAQSGLAFGDEE